MEVVFSLGPDPMLYNEVPRPADRQSQCDFDFDSDLQVFVTSVETGSNTPTVTLRVIGGDEKGSLRSERVKYSHESQGTRTRERLPWQGPAGYTKDRPVFSSKREPHINKTVTVNQ
jgi:hypothetical protein